MTEGPVLARPRGVTLLGDKKYGSSLELFHLPMGQPISEGTKKFLFSVDPILRQPRVKT